MFMLRSYSALSTMKISLHLIPLDRTFAPFGVTDQSRREPFSARAFFRIALVGCHLPGLRASDGNYVAFASGSQHAGAYPPSYILLRYSPPTSKSALVI